MPTTAAGVDGLLELPGFDEIDIVFDATSAKAHEHIASRLQPLGKRPIDLTPAAIGRTSYRVNLEAHIDAPNVNMVTCGGQAGSSLNYGPGSHTDREWIGAASRAHRSGPVSFRRARNSRHRRTPE